MARIRTIKPEFFTDDDVAELEPLERLLFIGLWTQADRAGRMDDKPRALKARLFPYDNVDVDAMLTRLADRGFVRRYVVRGERYMDIPKFTEHQVINGQERGSDIPAFEEADLVQASIASEPAKTPVEAPKTTRLDALSTRGSTRDDASNTRRDAYPKEGKGREGRELSAPLRERLDETFQRVTGSPFRWTPKEERDLEAVLRCSGDEDEIVRRWETGLQAKYRRVTGMADLARNWNAHATPVQPTSPTPEPETKWRTLAPDEDPYADQMQPPPEVA